MNKVEEQIVNTIEVICEACMPYICTYWEMEPTVRLKQCKSLRDWIDRIITDDLALIDRETELPKNPRSIYTGGMSEREVGELDGFNKAIDQVFKAGFTHSIIPLKEALELKNETKST